MIDTEPKVKPAWAEGLELYHSPVLGGPGTSWDGEGDRLSRKENYDEANLISSAIANTDKKLHRPLIDIDMPCYLIPSRTPGHFHLVIDKPVETAKFQQILDALHNAGIVQQGILHQMTQNGMTTLRRPGDR